MGAPRPEGAEGSAAGPSSSRPGPSGGRALRDLALAIGVGALIWLGDHASGRPLARTLGALADRLGIWYEDRRRPAVTCLPGQPVPHRDVEGIAFEAPACWEEEVAKLLDMDVHRFHDPEARAGIVSLSVEPAESLDERQILQAQFSRLASIPGAIVDGAKTATTIDRPLAARSGSWRPSGSDSLAERLIRRPGADLQATGNPAEGSLQTKGNPAEGSLETAPSGGDRGDRGAAPETAEHRQSTPLSRTEGAQERSDERRAEAPSGPHPGTRPHSGTGLPTRLVPERRTDGDGTELEALAPHPAEDLESGDASPGRSGTAAAPGAAFHRVEVGGRMEATDPAGPGAGADPGARYARRTWSWLLLGRQRAVRIVYTVRADWDDSPVVAEEFERVRRMVASIRPRP